MRDQGLSQQEPPTPCNSTKSIYMLQNQSNAPNSTHIGFVIVVATCKCLIGLPESCQKSFLRVQVTFFGTAQSGMCSRLSASRYLLGRQVCYCIQTVQGVPAPNSH